jgi:anaphase-promoting complex subunit 10
MYFDYLIDESYTPSQISISAGTGLYDLTEVKIVELHQPRGWQTVHVGDYGREYAHTSSPLPNKPFWVLRANWSWSSGVITAFLVQIAILTNHQNGKDTHLRGVKIFAPDMEHSRKISTGLEGSRLDEEQEKMFSIR